MENLYKIFSQSTGITTDSRKSAKGNIYFALSGDKFDGNVFADSAIEQGCSHAVIDKAEYKKNDRYLLVDDCLTALQDLARFHRNNLSIPVIGVTGSNGKTTTKELIAGVLAKKYQVLYTQGNLNNHIGVPLTVLKIDAQTEIAIIEMGANHQQEIEFLCTISKPSHGIITNIGKAHLEGFGGFEGVKKTKNELFVYLIQNQGTVFYNSDNAILSSLLEGKAVNKVFFGSREGSVCAGNVQKSDPYLEFEIPGKGVIETQLAGAYNLENALAAVTFGVYFKIPFDEIKNALEAYTPTNQRSQMKQTEKNILLMDCYNANPSSMEAALQNFSKVKHSEKVVVLGDMLELGEEALQEHAEVIKLLRDMDLQMVVLVGPIFCSLALSPDIKCFRSAEEAKEWINKQNMQNYLVLLKGSRGIKLEQIAEIL
jgi:UDP-N-acetylmuramoyl-tripeptide--D-alanyl-D-alanine ligase